MKLKLFTLIFFCIIARIVHAQNTFPSTGSAGIGTTTPAASALLEMKSTTKGLLIPRLTQAQRTAITSPATGLLTFQTDNTTGFYYYNGSGWNSLAAKSKTWSLIGNTGTDPSIDFLGTVDAQPFIFRTNNVERMRIQSNGAIGIGTKTPVGALNIIGTTYASLSTPGYLVVGDTSSYNIGFDNEGIQARNKGGAATLYLNARGGGAHIGDSSLSYTGVAGYGHSYGVTGISPQVGVAGYGGYGGSFISRNGIGVYGEDDGNNQGVYGYEAGHGEAVYGKAVGDDGFGVEGYSTQSIGVFGYTGNTSSYAGYFAGNVFSTGSYTSSDLKLKENITDVSSAMDIISQLKPKLYNFRQDGSYKLMNLPAGEHYGLIAQDVEKILPWLVKDSKFDVDKSAPQDKKNINETAKVSVEKTGEVINFKALNYTELIPIIIKGMQEINNAKDSAIKNLQNQINELKALILSANHSNNINSNNEQAMSINNESLSQNIPNPYTNSTIIKYSLPAKYTSAQIIISDKSGKLMSQQNVSGTGRSSIIFNASSLASGSYQYSLHVDGKQIGSRQMMIIK